MNIEMYQGDAGTSGVRAADRRSPVNRLLHKAISRLRIAEARAAQQVPASEMQELSDSIHSVVEAVRERLSMEREVPSDPPAWCQCGALIPTRNVVDLPLPVGIWWAPDETPPGGVCLLVAVRGDNGQACRALAEFDSDMQIWRFVGDFPTGARPCHPLAWCYLPSLPRWLREAP